MSVGVYLLILEIVVFAAWLVTHVALWVRVWGVTGITTWERVIAVLFPPQPAWKHDRKWHALLWLLLAAVYGALRAVLALR